VSRIPDASTVGAAEPSSAGGPDSLWPLRGARIDSAALIEPGGAQPTSYAGLIDVVERLARGLAAAGVGVGDIVAYALPNSGAAVALFLGTAAARAAAAPLNPGYSRDEFATYLRDLSPRVMVFDGVEPAAARRACRDLDIAQVDIGGGDVRRLAVDGVVGGGPSRTPEPDDIALLLHTSGTTSTPKSVPLRHRNLAVSARTIAASYELGPTDVSHCIMPLFHVHGLVASALAALDAGGAVLIPRRFSARSFWRDSRSHRATWFSAVPTMHRVLLERETPGDAGSLRFARSCSAALPGSVQEAFEDRIGIPLVQAYGMTEASHQMSTNPLPPGKRPLGSVGKASGTEIAIVDESWRPVDAESTGAVMVRGPGVVEGYLNAAEATASAFRDGWFHTGDIGTLSPDGYLRLRGRTKEMINRGGEKISPYEVEDVLLSHPSVCEAAVFALSHDRYGEVVGAIVVGPAADPAALRRHCAERLAAFKVPSRISVMPSIPKSSTGKVQRRLLSELIER
jgi:oxalate---CoA ligase